MFLLQMKYGFLLACCKTTDGRCVCILRGLEAMVSPLGTAVTNEYDCPLLMLSNTVFTVKATEVLKDVSVVHECTESCQFVERAVPRNVEREDVSVSRLEFEHDFDSNIMYCLNIFCMTT